MAISSQHPIFRNQRRKCTGDFEEVESNEDQSWCRDTGFMFSHRDLVPCTYIQSSSCAQHTLRLAMKIWWRCSRLQDHLYVCSISCPVSEFRLVWTVLATLKACLGALSQKWYSVYSGIILICCFFSYVVCRHKDSPLVVWFIREWIAMSSSLPKAAAQSGTGC